MFTLDVLLSAPLPVPANDTCASPAVLTVGGPGVTGDTRAATDDYARGPMLPMVCSSYRFDGNDLVYQFTAATTGTVRVTVTPSSTFDPALMVFTGTCGAAACTAALDSNASGRPETLTVSTVAGTMYYVVVDNWDRAFSSSSGTFTLALQ